MVFWAFKINAVITIDLNAWLVGLGGLLSLGIAIFETYRECSMRNNKLGDESSAKEEKTLRKYVCAACGGLMCCWCIGLVVAVLVLSAT